MLVGNQCDKTQDREVTKEEGGALAKSYGCPFFETSAKTTQNVDQMFMDVVRALRGRINDGSPKPQSVKKTKCIIL